MTRKYFETRIDVKYRETDAMGHVSSPVYYDYLQHAYLTYMHDLLELPYSEKLPHIMVKTSCEYLKPAQYGDTITVRSSVTRFGSKSFELEYLMVRDGQADADESADDHAVVARAVSTHVMFDYGSKTAVPVPEEFRTRVLSFQGAI
ncbi:thioesterase [Burkholderia anthina]|uniref:acyl-CoA thioesterase n=1 Tax=Burkholderia anthina TaxID=179879 RepID=UPI000753846B|nr:thioesterase family protein [Burkholderia anthina]KVH03531.1 thioesterase [Burkholderia anthina]KVH05221.1 thioesterase [Burkholderia anthina]KVM98160.1 thioesterase [Burkholderia anthina]KVX37320.1 thioesterase [Burkholderia anthina]